MERREIHIIALLGLVTCMMAAGRGAATTMQTMEPTPQGALLRVLARGERNATSLVKPVRECVDVPPEKGGCEFKIGILLAQLTAEGEKGQETVREVLAAVGEGARTDAQKRRVERIREYSSVGRGPATLATEAEQESEGVEAELSGDELAAFERSPRVGDRLERLLWTRIGGDTRSRVRVAFENATLERCDEVLGGTMIATCAALPRGAMRQSLIRVGVRPIYSQICTEDLSSVYGGLGREQLEKVAGLITSSGNVYLAGYDMLLRKWAKRPPSKWEAWADAAALVGW